LPTESTRPPDRDWLRAVAREALGDRFAVGFRAFAECRADVRIEFRAGEPPAVIETRRSGVAVASGNANGYGAHRSIDPPPGSARATPELAVEAGLAAADAALAAATSEPGVRVRGVWIASDQHVTIVDRDGRTVRDRRHGTRVALEARLDGAPEARARVDRVEAPGRPIDPVEAVAALVERVRTRRKPDSFDPGPTAAVFASGVGGALVHELIGHALEGDVTDAPLLEEGFGFANPEVRVIDDPRRGRVPWAFDDEGEPARAVGLIDRGRVSGRLFDRDRAASCGQASTGHGRRASYLDAVRPRMGCTFLAAGRDDSEAIVADTARGLFVRRMEAAWADPIAGAAWFRVADADRIVAGRIAAPVRPFLLEVRLEDLRSSLDGVASDVSVDTCIATCVKGGQPLAMSVGAPTIRVGMVRVLQ